MSDLLPNDDPLGDSQPNDSGNATIRVLWRAVAVSVGATFVLAVLIGATDGVYPALGEALVSLLVFAVFGIPVVCIVAAIVYYVRGQNAHGLGFLLAGLITPIIGFGTCLGTLIMTGF